MWERDKIFYQYCKENSVERRNNLFCKENSKIANIWKGIRSQKYKSLPKWGAGGGGGDNKMHSFTAH